MSLRSSSVPALLLLLLDCMTATVQHLLPVCMLRVGHEGAYLQKHVVVGTTWVAGGPPWGSWVRGLGSGLQTEGTPCLRLSTHNTGDVKNGSRSIQLRSSCCKASFVIKVREKEEAASSVRFAFAEEHEARRDVSRDVGSRGRM